MIISELCKIAFLQEKKHTELMEFHRECIMINVIMDFDIYMILYLPWRNFVKL